MAKKRKPRPPVELLQGTLDLIVLRALWSMGPQHSYGLAARLEQVADHPLTLNQGTLYPALVRLAGKGWIKGSWQLTDTHRRANTTRLRPRARKCCRGRLSVGGACLASSTS